MIKDLKSKIQKLTLEKDKTLVELGKMLKNSNVIELKKLASYTSLKLIEKELSQLKVNLTRSEDNENKLKELHKNLKEYTISKKITLKIYKSKLIRIAEAIINNYPNNLKPILEYKMNFTKSMLEKHKYKITKTIDNEKIDFFKKLIKNIKIMLKAIINKIYIGKVAKEFEKRILKKYSSSENLEKLVNEFVENTDLNKELIEEFRLMNETHSSVIKINNDIKETKNQSIKDKINNKHKIENDINFVQTNKDEILKRIAEEFIEMSKTDKGLSKIGTIGSLLQTIENLNQQISKLNEDLIKTIKIEEIATIQAKMQQLIKNKESIENKLNELNSKIRILQNEIDELDNK
ncbi:coiled-coil domain-containing protein [Candidatus Borreliella tachyglossi]|uniref:coiled-coil domain-containing protein n=1 Tax=Candidatus Borreliella tachyglossi TaxID=1964448 RepID=UPI004042231A